MGHRGRVTNGQVVLDPPAHLPEGAEVIVEVIEPKQAAAPQPNGSPLMHFAGKAQGLPEDASETIDEILYKRDAS